MKVRIAGKTIADNRDGTADVSKGHSGVFFLRSNAPFSAAHFSVFSLFESAIVELCCVIKFEGGLRPRTIEFLDSSVGGSGVETA